MPFEIIFTVCFHFLGAIWRLSRAGYQGDVYSAGRAVMDNVSLAAMGSSSHRQFWGSSQVNWQYQECCQLDIGVLQLALEPPKLPKCCLLSALC